MRKNDRILYKSNKFNPQYHVMLFIFAHNVMPKKSGKSEYRISAIHFLDKMFHRNMYDHSPLYSIIVNYIQIVARSISGKTYFGFPYLISFVIERYGVNVEGQKRTTIHPLDTMNTPVLRRLQLSLAIINAIEHGGQADVRSNLRRLPGMNTKHDPRHILCLHMDFWQDTVIRRYL